MKQSLRNKVSTIRGKILDLIDDLQERVDELEWRDDPEGKWADEISEIEQLMEYLDEANMNIEEFE